MNSIVTLVTMTAPFVSVCVSHCVLIWKCVRSLTVWLCAVEQLESAVSVRPPRPPVYGIVIPKTEILTLIEEAVQQSQLAKTKRRSSILQQATHVVGIQGVVVQKMLEEVETFSISWKKQHRHERGAKWGDSEADREVPEDQGWHKHQMMWLCLACHCGLFVIYRGLHCFGESVTPICKIKYLTSCVNNWITKMGRDFVCLHCYSVY